jgi:hypothetical protein
VFDASAAREYGLIDHVIASRRISPHLPSQGGEPGMPPPALAPLPALTRAEAEFVDRCLKVLDLVGRINPAAPPTPTRPCTPRRR